MWVRNRATKKRNYRPYTTCALIVSFETVVLLETMFTTVFFCSRSCFRSQNANGAFSTAEAQCEGVLAQLKVPESESSGGSISGSVKGTGALQFCLPLRHCSRRRICAQMFPKNRQGPLRHFVHHVLSFSRKVSRGMRICRCLLFAVVGKTWMFVQELMKSQYCFGGLDLLCATGVFDSAAGINISKSVEFFMKKRAPFGRIEWPGTD